MGYCMEDVTPVRKQWSYVILLLTRRYNDIIVIEQIMEMFTSIPSVILRFPFIVELHETHPLPWASGPPVAIQCACNLDPSEHWNATGEIILVASVLPVVFQWLSSGLPVCSNYVN